MIASSSAVRPLVRVVSRVCPRVTAGQTISRQPFSSSCIPAAASPSSSSSADAGPSKPATRVKAAKKAVSSCPAGTVMTGLSILKDQADPVALPDDQYPAWLWTILDEPSASSTKTASAQSAGKGEGKEVRRKAPGEMKTDDEFLQERRRLRALNKENIKASNYLKTA